jgi:hypothetical protein
MTRHIPDRAVRRRDAAVRRLRRVKQTVTALSFVCAGIVGTAAASSFPGHAHHGASTGRATPGEGTSASTRTVHRTHRSAIPRRGGSTTTSSPTSQSTAPVTQTATQPAQTASTPAPPATTPAPAPAASAPVVSGGS